MIAPAARRRRGRAKGDPTDRQRTQHFARRDGRRPGRAGGVRRRREHAVPLAGPRWPAEGGAVLEGVVQRAAVHALAGILFMTERYVRDRGMTPTRRRWPPTAPPTPGPCGKQGLHTSCWARPISTWTRSSRCRTWTTWPGGWRPSASPRCSRPGRRIRGEGADPLHRLPVWVAACSRRTGLTSRTAAIRARRGRLERHEVRPPCGTQRPMPLPLDAYVDTWHGMEAVRWIESYDRDQPFFLLVGFPGPHDPWDTPAEAVDPLRRRRDLHAALDQARRHRGDRELAPPARRVCLWLSDTETMTNNAIRGMRRGSAADISVIDHAVGLMVDALERTGRLDRARGSSTPVTTAKWRAARNDVQVDLRTSRARPARGPPAGRLPARGGRLPGRATRHPKATVRAIAPVRPGCQAPRGAHCWREGTPAAAGTAGGGERELGLRLLRDGAPRARRRRGRRVTPCQLFDLEADPDEDHDLLPDPQAASVVDELVESSVQLPAPPGRHSRAPASSRARST